MPTGAYLKYGGYSHEGGEVSLAISRRALTENGVPYGYMERWDVNGMLLVDNGSLVSQMRSLESAYAQHGRDIGFYLESGQIAHQLRNSDTARGTVVVARPSYTQQGRAELANYRRYALSVEGEIHSRNSLLISWAEVINWHGNGGPRWGYLVPITGFPVAQYHTQGSIVTVTQEGTAVGMNAYPLANPAIWPDAEVGEQQRITMALPDLNSPFRQISWSYTFRFTSQPIATPVRRL